MASEKPPKVIRFFNITHPGLILVLWDIFFGLPIAYLLTHFNKFIFQQLGYEKFMRSPGGARLNQCVFVFVNVWLVIGWGWQLMQEVKEQREENIRVIKEEIRYWGEEIERLERLLEEKQIEEQLLGSRYRRARSEGGEPKMAMVNGEMRWLKGGGEGKAGKPYDLRRGGLGAAKTGLREPSPLYRSRF